MTTATPPPRPWLRRVALHSLLAGLCPLIPVPFLDDRVQAAVRRRMVRELTSASGRLPPPPTVETLAGLDQAFRPCGCAVGVALAVPARLAVRLAAKLFRRITVVLAVKEAVEVASRTFHEGYLLHHALATRAEEVLGEPARVRGAIDRTCRAVDTRPVHRVVRRLFHDSRRLLSRAVRLLTRSGRQEGGPRSEEERLLSSLADRMAAALGRESAYLEALEETFRGQLAEGRPARDDSQGGAS